MAHFLDPDEVLQLLAEARKHSEVGWLMCALAFLYQMRAHEVVGGWVSWKNKKTGEKKRVYYPGLRPSNIIGNRLKVKRLKGSNPIDEELFESENSLLDVRKPVLIMVEKTHGNQKLFPVSARTFQRWIKAFGVAAGLPKAACHPHTMKSSALDYLREKMPLEELQIVSGHKNLNSLRVYLNPKKSVAAKKARAAFGCLAV